MRKLCDAKSVDLVFSSSTFIWIRVNVYLLIDVVGTSFSLSLVQFTRSPPVGWLVWCAVYVFNCHIAVAARSRILVTIPITNWNTNFEKLSFSTLTILRKKGQIYLKNEKRRRKHRQQQQPPQQSATSEIRSQSKLPFQ